MNKLMMMAMAAAMGIVGPALATTIGYSGQLRGARGEVLDEDQRNPTIEFAFYDVPREGTALGTLKKKVQLNAEGNFAVELDLPDAADQKLRSGSAVYIGLAPNGTDEIKPRQKILPTPYAVVAEVAQKGASGFSVSGKATVKELQADAVTVKGSDGTYSPLLPLPAGVIVMWSGKANEIPAGWHLCDGNSDGVTTTLTIPDLRGKFIVGYDPNDGDYNEIGKKGGEKTVTLTEEQMPKHKHDVVKNMSTTWSVNGGGLAVFASAAQFPDVLTGEKGGNQPHENRPPYYALCYIIKL